MDACILFGHTTNGPFLTECVIVHENPICHGWNARGSNQMGYGSKITTRYMIQRKDEKRKRRVYASQWGNSSAFWCIIDGKKEHLNFGY